jgi:20S proteasome subunit beta 4
MEVQIALTGKDYAIIAADMNSSRSIVKMKTDEDKVKILSPHLLMSYSGEPGASISLLLYCFSQETLGDTVHFAEYIERNLRLHAIRQDNHHALRPSSAASWIRRTLAESIRSRKPYAVNLLVGGYDTATNTPHLYWIDYLGTLIEVPFAAQGYGSYFVLSLFDRCATPSLFSSA